MQASPLTRHEQRTSWLKPFLDSRRFALRFEQNLYGENASALVLDEIQKGASLTHQVVGFDDLCRGEKFIEHLLSLGDGNQEGDIHRDLVRKQPNRLLLIRPVPHLFLKNPRLVDFPKG